MNQFKKTTEERKTIKEAKKAYKVNKNSGFPQGFDGVYEVVQKHEPKEIITNGIMEDEDILPNTFPVYANYYYVIEHENGTANVMLSYFSGPVHNFIKDLKEYPGYKAKYRNLKNVRRCNMAARNLF